MRIGIVAPSSRLEPAVAESVTRLAATLYPSAPPELHFHPQCFLSAGHFAGDDEARAAAFLEVANDPSFDALWFARRCGRARSARTHSPEPVNSSRRTLCFSMRR